jgi:hypothetical protein
MNNASIVSGTFTGLASGILGFNQISLQAGGINTFFDDLYCTDGEFLGDVRIYPLYPHAAGSLTQWTPSGTGANYTMVNEHATDDSATYVSTGTVGNSDEYYMDPITGFTGSIKGAQGVWTVEKTDGGVATVQGLWKSGTTTINTASFNPSYTSWLTFLAPYRQSPFTSTDWTVAEINALQLGITRTA